ncbi:hypothetical protein [Streptomyces asoensis]|uniref:hypothetical protein n=1 Tax=Streptomyces asoensis TaxID=249586 RepID=UPI003407B37D
MPRTTLLRQLLQQRHLTTHEAFAAQYERAAARLAELDRDPRLASLQVSPRQFDRWYGGELLTLPRPDACRVLEHMLGRPVSELFSTAYDGDSAHDRDEESSTGREATSAPPPREGDENPLDIVTRTRQLTASNADDATLAFLDSSLEGIVGRYEQDGPYVLRPQARQVRQLAHTLLDGRQPPRTRRELFRLAARASGLLGYMAVNMGDFALSEAYCTEARDLSVSAVQLVELRREGPCRAGAGRRRSRSPPDSAGTTPPRVAVTAAERGVGAVCGWRPGRPRIHTLSAECWRQEENRHRVTCCPHFCDS